MIRSAGSAPTKPLARVVFPAALSPATASTTGRIRPVSARPGLIFALSFAA
ncbi:MAG: hypothetical protein ACR2G2_02855 [Pseudonocardia sp.]